MKKRANAAVEEALEMERVICLDEGLMETQSDWLLYSHAHWLPQLLDVFAVAVNAVALVTVGAGIHRGAAGRRDAHGDAARVLGVQWSRASVPVPVLLVAVAPLLLLLIFNGR